jgi:hypothetical protein
MTDSVKLPSNYTSFAFGSILQKSEAETIARNIMVILFRTGNEWRRLEWDEYKSERLKDGQFTEAEREWFDKVIDYTVCPENADKFCSEWYKKDLK